MRHFQYIDINESRINYELKTYGSAVIGVPSSSTEDDIGAAMIELKSKYDHVSVDVNGDLVITNKCQRQGKNNG